MGIGNTLSRAQQWKDQLDKMVDNQTSVYAIGSSEQR
jgi:hypothetical protein